MHKFKDVVAIAFGTVLVKATGKMYELGRFDLSVADEANVVNVVNVCRITANTTRI